MFPIILYLTFYNPEDEKRFIYLVNRYGNTMLKAANDILDNESDSEDAVQEAFIKLYLGYDRYKDYDENGLITLLYIITKNKAIDIYRKEHKSNLTFIEYNDEEIPDPISINNEEGCSVFDIMNKLSGTDRDVLLLKYYYNFNIKEIAEMFKISTQGAYKKIERAKSKLSEAMKEISNE